MFEPWILFILAAISCASGFAWLALSMNVHWQQVMHSTNTPSEKTRTRLRVSGALALLITGILCFSADRPSMAVLVWLMLSAVTAPSISMLLAWRPKLLRVFWPAKV
jgi:Protein of unknown function (DUF3325)